MHRIRHPEERETLVDHLIGALLAAMAMLLTVALRPVFAFLKTGGVADFWAIYLSYGPVPIWGALLVGAAFTIALVVGPGRMEELYGHLWGTEEPQRPAVTFGLWLGVAMVIALGFALSQI